MREEALRKLRSSNLPGGRGPVLPREDHPALHPPKRVLDRITTKGTKTEICGEEGSAEIAAGIAAHAEHRGIRTLVNVPSGGTEILECLQRMSQGKGHEGQREIIFTQVQDWDDLLLILRTAQADLLILDGVQNMEPPRPEPRRLPGTRVEIHPGGLSGQANLEAQIILECAPDNPAPGIELPVRIMRGAGDC